MRKRHHKLGPKMKHFCTKMDASFMHTMNISNTFVKIFKGSISKNIRLEASSGITWHVKLIRSNNTFALRSGWKDFVSDNKIDENDVLVFTYNGNSSFKVLIFDPSGCEKAAPFFAVKIGTESEELNGSSIQVISAPHSEVKKEIIYLSSGSDVESSREISSCAARMLMTGERFHCKRKRGDFLHESTESDGGIKHRPVKKTKEKSSRIYILPRRTYLTKDQEKTANKMARRTQKGSDLFVKVLTRSNIHTHRSSLNLPSSFACEVLRSMKQKIAMLPADLDKSKGCTAKFCKAKNVRRVVSGWCRFVAKNGLKEGDLCLFELRKQEKQGTLVLTMVVHINHK